MTNAREIKTAENKQQILKALLKILKKVDFETIKISKLCAEAGVSQASFYNYFPQKNDLIFYYVQLWSIEMQLKLLSADGLTGLKAIELIFTETVKSICENPNVMSEIVSYQAKRKTRITLPPLGDADKIIAFPNVENPGTIPTESFDKLMTVHLNKAVENKELPKNTSVISASIALGALFFGLPTVLKEVPDELLKDIYIEQLAVIWAGIKNHNK